MRTRPRTIKTSAQNCCFHGCTIGQTATFSSSSLAIFRSWSEISDPSQRPAISNDLAIPRKMSVVSVTRMYRLLSVGSTTRFKAKVSPINSIIPLQHDCCVHFHPSREHAHDRDRTHDCAHDRDRTHARDHDRDRDRDRDLSKPVRKIAAFISQYQAGVCLPATRIRLR